MDSKIERREHRRQLAAKAELKHGKARRAAGKTTSHLQDRLIAEEESHGRTEGPVADASPEKEGFTAPPATSSRQWGDYEVLGQDNFDD